MSNHELASNYELDRLFGLALTDSRFFQHLRQHPHNAASQFDLTEIEINAVVGIAPAVRTAEDLAFRLDRWMTLQEQDVMEPAVEPEFIGLDSAAQSLDISDDVLLQLVREGRIRLSKQDVSQVAVQVMSRQYA